MEQETQPQPKPPVLPQNQNGFTKKTVETPILSADFRDRIQLEKTRSSFKQAFMGFYKANKFYFWAIFAGLAIIFILVYVAFFRRGPATAPTGANVSVSIQAPDAIASGSDVLYKIILENNDNQKLVNLQLEMVYPDGVGYISSTPNADNLSGTTFTIPDLIPGQNAAVLIKAQTSGNINDIKNLIARLHYHYSSFSSEFTKEQAFSIHIIASDINMQLSGPATANNGDSVVYTLSYGNNSQSDINNAKIQLDYPDGFTFTSSNPSSSQGQNNVWPISSLPQGSQGTITITGTFNAAPGESKTLTASFLALSGTGSDITQASTNFTTAIASEPLIVSQQAQSQSQQQGIANPGDTVTVTVNYKNNSNVAATGVNIVVNLNSKAIDPASIRAQGAQISGTTILWNAASVPGLDTLAPNGSGTLLYSFNLNNPAVRDSSKNITVDNQAKIKSNEYASYFSGNDLALKISSPSAISAKVDYVSGSQPPQVGQTTTYKVTLSLTNATNDFSNTVVTAYIPLGPNGFDQTSVSAGEKTNVNFDPSTNQLTWQVGALPAHTGQFVQARSVQFNVRLNPSASDAGRSPVLVKTIVMNASDIFTNASVQNQAADLSTQDGAGNNFGNGVVQQ